MRCHLPHHPAAARFCFAELSFFTLPVVKTAVALKIFRKLSARTAGVCYFFSFGQKPISTEGNYIGA
jgi:hypothetical protein